MSRFTLLLVVAPMVILAAAVCKEPPFTECGCPRRGTFDQAYLESDYPQIISKYPGFSFYAPTVTYPNCSAILTECYQENSVMVALINGTTDITTIVDYVTMINPYNVPYLICNSIHEWVQMGVGSIQATLNSYKLGCKKAN
uniref:Uncharacterized protein n=1 Tax=Caenorhabditis tropicalis TaxID=1561998 RepID=A0A1I7TCE1_9PELO